MISRENKLFFIFKEGNFMEDCFSKGIFVLSLDTELAWRMNDKPLSVINNAKYFYDTRKAIDGIIKLVEKYEISATWAVVGSLLLDRPNFNDELSDALRNLRSDVRNRYLKLLEQESIWSGKDILKKIQSASIPQEIGSHSFSHLIIGDKKVSREQASNEFINSIRILKQHGVVPESFIFPRNSINYLDELAEAGFKSYRGVEPSWYANLPSKIRKVCHIIDQLLALRHLLFFRVEMEIC